MAPATRHQHQLGHPHHGGLLSFSFGAKDHTHWVLLLGILLLLLTYIWSRQVPIFARALVLADETLLIAGPPEQAELRTGEFALQNPDEAEAVFQGSKGAALCLIDAADGTRLAQYELESSPVFDGMIAARDRIFLALADGSLVCFGQ